MPELRGGWEPRRVPPGMNRRSVPVEDRSYMKSVSVECPWGLILKIAEPSAPYTHPVGGGAGGHTLRRPLLYLITRVWDVD